MKVNLSKIPLYQSNHTIVCDSYIEKIGNQTFRYYGFMWINNPESSYKIQSIYSILNEGQLLIVAFHEIFELLIEIKKDLIQGSSINILMPPAFYEMLEEYSFFNQRYLNDLTYNETILLSEGFNIQVTKTDKDYGIKKMLKSHLTTQATKNDFSLNTLLLCYEGDKVYEEFAKLDDTYIERYKISKHTHDEQLVATIRRFPEEQLIQFNKSLELVNLPHLKRSQFNALRLIAATIFNSELFLLCSSFIEHPEQLLDIESQLIFQTARTYNKPILIYNCNDNTWWRKSTSKRRDWVTAQKIGTVKGSKIGYYINPNYYLTGIKVIKKLLSK